MTTVTISSGTTSVSSHIPNTTAYLVEGSGALDIVSGGTVSGPITVKSGGVVSVSSGGEVLNTVISSGGSQFDFGTAINTTITSHGSQSVEVGGAASSTIIGKGGEQDVFGSATNTTVESGGLQVVKSGGVTSNTTIVNGGTLWVSSGGLADPTKIFAGGTEIVSSGGTDDGAQISGGIQKVYGSASGATVFTGSQVIETGGTASNTTVKAGGTAIVSSGGVLSNTIVSAGGTIDIEAGGSLNLSATTVSNAGSINLLGSSGGASATLLIESNVTLTGGGKVSLSSSGNNFITDGGSPETLTNVNNTISGAGTIGDSDLTLVNSGTIDANIVGGTLTVKTGTNPITNSGLMEAIGGNLVISGDLTNFNAIEAFEAAGNFASAGVFISGNTITNSNTVVASAVNTFSLASVSISGGTVTNSKTIEALANHAADLVETFSNGFLISDSGPGGADVTISASGMVTNSGTILGSAIGLNSDALVSVVAGGTVINAASGTLEALAAGAGYASLSVSGGTISNSGTIVGSGTGNNSEATLGVSGGTVTNAGTIEVVAFGGGPLAADTPAASGSVDTANLINTGTLKAAGSGAVSFYEQGGYDYEQVAFGNAEMVVSGATMTNSGTLGAFAAYSEADTTLRGGTLTNSNTIEALGTGVGGFGLGAGAGEAEVSISASSFTNRGTVLASATVNGFAAVSVTSGVTNSGTIEALGSVGGLAMVDLKGAVNNVSGTILASGTAFVDLDGATVSGGALETSHVTELYALSTIIKSAGTSAGVFDGSGIGVFAGGSATVSDATIAAGSYVAAWHHSSLLTLSGATFGSGAEAQALQGGTVTLIGGTTLGAGAIVEAGTSGTVIIEGTVSNTSTSLIVASGVAAQVDLDSATISGGILKTSGGTTAVIRTVSNTTDVISGVTVALGSLVEATNGGVLQLSGTVTNSGTLLGSGGTVALDGNTVNAGVIEGATSQSVLISGGVVNSKTIEAFGTSASVEIVGATISNTATGLVLASGTGAQVQLDDAVISGGTLRTSGTGAKIDTVSGTTTNLLSNVTIAAGSLVEVIDGSDLTLGGTIVNSGTIEVDLVPGSATLFIAASGATLTGGGTVKMGGSDAFFGSNGTPATLTNINNTISGAGAIADANLTLVNSGTVNANNAAALTINTGAHAITNSGTLEATSTGGLVIDSNVNNSKTIEALGTSASVTIASTISNTATGLVLASGAGAQVQLDNASILGGKLQTFGTNAVIETVVGTTDVISGGTILVGSLVKVTDGSELALKGTIFNSGTIVVSGAVDATALNLDNATVSGGKLALSAGNVMIETVSGTLDAIDGATIVSNSFVTVVSGSTLTLSGGTIGSNTTVETQGGTAIVSGVVTNSGTLFASGTGSVIDIVGVVVGGGTAEVGNGIVDIQAANSTENVSFQSSGTGGLKLHDTSVAPTDYKGKISGFGNLGDNTTQFIDLVSVTYSAGVVTETYSATNASSGVLTVSSGTHVVAEISLLGGGYTTAGFTLSAGSGGIGTVITDPPVIEQNPGNAAATIVGGAILEINTPDSGNVTFAGSTGKLVLDQPGTFTGTVAGLGAQNGIDLSQIAFGAATTLAFSENDSHTGGTLTVTDGTHTAAIALLGNYMASTLVTGADGHGGTLVTEAPQAAVQPLLTHPQHG